MIEGSITVAWGEHRIFIDTPQRPQALDVWVEPPLYHCGGCGDVTLSAVHVYGHGFEFGLKVQEGAATVRWQYKVG